MFTDEKMYRLGRTDLNPNIVYPLNEDDRDVVIGDEQDFFDQLGWLIENQEEVAGLLTEAFRDSGVTVKLHNGFLGFFPEIDSAQVSLSESELMERQQRYFGQQRPIDQLPPQEISALLKLYAREGLGGIGITARSLAELRSGAPEIIDSVLERISSQKNAKIIFLGNGFSRIPEEFLTLIDSTFDRDLSTEDKVNGEHYFQGEFVIADLFSVERVLEAFQKFQILFLDKFSDWSTVPASLMAWLRRAARIKRWSDREPRATLAPPYRLPTGRADSSKPPILANADVIINYMGPPESTLATQLSMLSPGGELWFVSVKDISLPDGFSEDNFTITTFRYRTKPEGDFGKGEDRVTAIRIQKK